MVGQGSCGCVVMESRLWGEQQQTEPHADLISAIRKVKEGFKCQLILKHMRRHQDARQAMVLERDATLNVEMDLRAKAKLVDTAGLGSLEIPFEGWTCYIGSRKIIKQWQLTLQEHKNENALCKHWQRKQRFGRGQANRWIGRWLAKP